MTPIDLLPFLDPSVVGAWVAGAAWLAPAVVVAAVVGRASDKFGGAS